MTQDRPHMLTRRHAVMGAALGLSCIALPACSGNEEETSQGGQTFTWGVKNNKESLDMQHSTQNGTIPGTICECLVSFSSEDRSVSPVLLTDLPTPSDDGLSYSFELKEGVKFHDGSTLTSSDVEYTFTRMFVPEQTSVCSGYYVMIKGAQEMLDGNATELAGFKVDDDRHFTIELEYAYAPFLSALTLAFAQIFPREACEAAGEDWGQGTLVGTGPYRLVSNDETGVSMEAFPDYHGGAPALSEIKVSYIDDNNTKMLSYKAGDIDACDLDATLLKEYQGDSEVVDQIVYYEPMGTCFLNINLNMPEFADPRVREALSLAINRQEIIDTMLSGAGTVATQFLNPGELGYDETRSEYAYDPERARELLSEAGAEGLSFTAMTRASEQNLMVALQAYWKEVGIDVKVETLDNGIWTETRAQGGMPATIVTWLTTVPLEGAVHLSSWFRSNNAATRSSFYNNAEFDATVDEALTKLDETERAALAQQADRILTEQDWGTIPLYYPTRQIVQKPWVSGIEFENAIVVIRDVSVDPTKK